MSEIAALTGALAGVAARVKDGDIRAAKRIMRDVIADADDESLRVIGWCAEVLENYPYQIAIQKLRNAWLYRANEQERALIAACVPEQDNGQYRGAVETVAAPRYGRENHRAPRESRRWVDPGRRKPLRAERQAGREANAARYFEEGRAGEADGVQLQDRDERARDARVYASGLDYDKAGVPDLRNLPCLSCWLERAVADAATDRVRAGHGDDGLCSECRESGRSGVPELPLGHTLGDAVAARCAFIVARSGASARAILRNEWIRAGRDTDRRDLIAAWVDQHLPETASPDQQPAAEAARVPAPVTAPAAVDGACECGSIRQLRGGQCVDCRKLDISAPATEVEAEFEAAAISAAVTQLAPGDGQCDIRAIDSAARGAADPDEQGGGASTRLLHLGMADRPEAERDTADHNAANLPRAPSLDEGDGSHRETEQIDVGQHEPIAAVDDTVFEAQNEAGEPELGPETVLGAHDHPHWTSRPHGRLVDAELDELTAREQHGIDELAAERAAADQRAERIQVEVETGQGPATAAVDANLARLLEQAAAVHAAEQLEMKWVAASVRAQAAAQERAQTEHDIGEVGPVARSRRYKLVRRIDELRVAEEQAQAEAADLAQRAADLQQHIGPREQRDRIVVAARAAEFDHPRVLEEAQDLDRETVEAAYRHAARLAELQQPRFDRLAALQAEQHLRERLPSQIRSAEDTQRAAPAPAATTAVTGPDQMSGAELNTPELTNPVLTPGGGELTPVVELLEDMSEPQPLPSPEPEI